MLKIFLFQIENLEVLMKICFKNENRTEYWKIMQLLCSCLGAFKMHPEYFEFKFE